MIQLRPLIAKSKIKFIHDNYNHFYQFKNKMFFLFLVLLENVL